MAEYSFDPAKAADNRRKHGVGFGDAITALIDPFRTSRFDGEHSGREMRYITIGMDVKGRLLAVVTSESETITRIISARRATKRERHAYEEHSS